MKSAIENDVFAVKKQNTKKKKKKKKKKWGWHTNQQLRAWP
jgi:hypothetical protein